MIEKLLLEIMDKESKEITSKEITASIQCFAANRKQILNYLKHEVDEQTNRITNAQQEIVTLKTVLSDARNRLERIKNGENPTKIAK